MSTFNGFVHEFPRIRIDYFRALPDHPPPLACFLSHVHSDHLVGLDSLKSPFVYCSSATREMLLRLEKYPHRINFAKGITEVSRKHYRHLRRLLKPLPLETPTMIELAPGQSVTVTLFNANHCLGAVSFLIEDDRRAVLYTGDIRAESWLLDSWSRHPKLLPYIPHPRGPGLRRLSTIYLDTTFAISSHMFARFSSKTQGLSELYRKVLQYPADTLFYLHSWTFGYEEVWLGLSHLLKTQTHLDRYRYAVYSSIQSSNVPGLEARETPWLCGTMLGNTLQPGILTRDQTVRLHSCEKGSDCNVMTKDGVARPIVHIKPIVGRLDDEEISERGLGGGSGDLDQLHALDLRDRQAVDQLKQLCEQRIRNPDDRTAVVALLDEHLSKGKAELALAPQLVSNVLESNLQMDLGLAELVDILAHTTSNLKEDVNVTRSNVSIKSVIDGSELPLEIKFPYARHSSYEELRQLVSLFRPLNVWPCTEPAVEDFDEGTSMEALFVDCCAGNGFVEGLESHAAFTWDTARRVAHDKLVQQGVLKPSGDRNDETQVQDSATEDDDDDPDLGRAIAVPRAGVVAVQNAKVPSAPSRPITADSRHRRSSTSSSIEVQERLRVRQEAYDAAVEGEWHRIRLKCTT